jgi:hypothetical protein
MSYHQRRQLSGDMAHGPRWYRAIGGVSSQPRRRTPAFGSLGADDPTAGNTLSTPTITDPTTQWQADVLTQLQAGVATLKTAELQKWLQILATVSIPLAAAIWNLILKKSPGQSGV